MNTFYQSFPYGSWQQSASSGQVNPAMTAQTAQAAAPAAGGMNYMGGATFALDGLSKALQAYVAAGAQPAPAPYKPTLANFDVPQLVPQTPIQG